ncbi:hypothetical protein [Azorhizobium doebereinerae]|uniref:hypothetical protein n=1 Tax=Azorhizobium doebereinerae TaxID=281091 RepID=UPI0012EBA607|nr:hypothetical protein [Azorhizobium doebereinerae]
MPRFMRGWSARLKPSARLKTMGLRAGVSASLTVGAMAFAQLHPVEVEPVRPLLAAAPIPGITTESDLFKIELPAPSERRAADADAPAPRPKARPRSAATSLAGASPAKSADAAPLPAGVERFDRCLKSCDTRDPVILAAWSPAPAPPARSPVVTPPLPGPPPSATRAPLHGVSLDGAMSMVAGGGQHVIDGGRQVIDGAWTTAGTTFDAVKSTMLEALGPSR